MVLKIEREDPYKWYLIIGCAIFRWKYYVICTFVITTSHTLVWTTTNNTFLGSTHHWLNVEQSRRHSRYIVIVLSRLLSAYSLTCCYVCCNLLNIFHQPICLIVARLLMQKWMDVCQSLLSLSLFKILVLVIYSSFVFLFNHYHS